MNGLSHTVLGTLAVSLFLAAAGGVEIDFARDIQPILSDNCYACHGPDEEERAAALRLDREDAAAAVLSPGDAGASELLARVTAVDPDDLMPPPDKKAALTKEQVELLRRWIDEGAKWGTHWAFEPPARPETPPTGDRSDNPIDVFVIQKLEEHGLTPSPEASRETLLRRASLDLTGLPPTLEELDAFLADEAPGAYERAVDRLLASPHYGERWARWWMDAARYADSNGYEKDSIRFVWPYRDWLIDSFNGNMPYDQFVIRQVGGDMLENATLSDRVATGFLRNSMVNEEGAIDAEQFRIEGIFDRMDALGKSVLGLTMQCAQCHTHKYDPITQEEYYGMFAFLNNSHEATVPYYTVPEQSEIADIEGELAGIRNRARAEIAERNLSFSAWVKARRAQLEDQPQWVTVTPTHLGDGGQKFYPQADGSIITKGYSPSRSTEKFAGESPVREIASLRLELLMDPYLTYGGPGRSIEGTVAISEIKLLAGTDPEKLTPVKFRPAVSDLDLPARPIDTKKYPQKDGKEDNRTEGPAAFANDGKAETAWATEAGWDRSNQPRLLVMNLEEPIRHEGEGPLHLQFEVHCQHGGWNSNDNHHRNLGRFRFSLAEAPYGHARPLSPEVAAILRKPEDRWSASEADRVLDEWIAAEPVAKQWADAMSTARERHPAPTPQLVLQEMADGRNTRLFHRGEQVHPRQEVRPHIPEFAHDLPEGTDPESRLTFARWLVDRDSPTAARAIANRFWHSFFGNGIVESLEDLGRQATPPSHPELLDWLAVEFMESGWDMQRLHKLIVTSRTYRQDSALRDNLAEIDPANRFLARGPRFRPGAETVRDIQLAASGLLDRSIGGDSVRPPIPRFLFDPPASYGYKEWDEDTEPSKRYRRALYTFRFRTVPPPFLSAFDAPSGEVSCVRRPRSTTPLQALVLLNEPLSVESAQALAETIRGEGGASRESLENAFRRCTSRTPSADEVDVLVRLFEAEKAAGADPFLAVARVLLNLDETITKS